MRFYSYIALCILGICALVVLPAATRGQPGGGKGNKGTKGGGGTSLFTDPKAAFESLAKGRNYFLITDSRMSQQLAEFAKQKNITNGQITLPQYLEFAEQLKSKWSGGGGFTPGGGKPSAGEKPNVVFAPPPGVTVLSPQQQQNPNVLNDLADAEFRRRDQNEDDMLTPEEMPGSLRDSLAKWDTNMDGYIDMLEYRPYYIAKLKGEGEFDKSGKGKKGDKTIIIIEEDNWDVRPKVLRAGVLHPDLPAWFKECDIDGDGQVALHEWHAKKKPIDEFRTWDANNDGFITQEEALKLKSALTAGTKKTGPGGATASTGSGERPSFGSAPGGPGGFMDRFKKDGDGGKKSKKDRP